MAQDLSTPSNALVKVRWQEPYASEGLNKKFNGLVPAGVIRGGRLSTSPLNSRVTVVADSETGDSIYSFIDSSGHQLTFRQIGDIVLDLDVGTLPGTTAYVGLEITYTVSAQTVVKWRGYSQAEVDVDPTIIVLGSVDVPAVAALIPASDIYDDRRRLAWMNIAQYMRDAVQVFKNGTFQFADTTAPSANDSRWPWWDYAQATLPAAIAVVSSGTPQIGENHLRFTLPGTPGQVISLPHESIHSVRGGGTVKVKFWIKGNTVTPGPSGSDGHMGIFCYVADDSLTAVQEEYIEDLSVLPGTFAYMEVERTFKLHDDARWLSIAPYYNDDLSTSTGTIYFDDIRVFIEQPHVNSGRVESYGDLSEGSVVARSVGVSPPLSWPSSVNDFISDILGLRWTSDGNYEFKRGADGVASFLLRLLNGNLRVDNDVESASAHVGTIDVGENIQNVGADLLGSSADALTARVFGDLVPNSTSKLTLLQQWDDPDDGRNVRVYGGGTTQGFVVTANAYWDEVAVLWKSDDATAWAYQLKIGSSSGFQLASHEPAVSWVAFNATDSAFGRLFTAYQNYTAVYKRIADLGADLVGSATDAAIPRLSGDTATTYTTLFEFGPPGSRQYRAFVSSSACALTYGAYWNGTQWVGDSGSGYAAYVRLENGYLHIKYKISSLTPWNEGDWVTLSSFVFSATSNPYLSHFGRIANLGDLQLASATDAAIPRISGETIGGYTCILEFGPSGLPKSRVYVSQYNIFATYNARWDGTGSVWYRDVGGYNANYFGVGRGNSNYFSVKYHDVASSPWDDFSWDILFQPTFAATDLDKRIDVPYRIDLGDSLVGSSINASLPRINGEVYAGAYYTNILQFGNSGVCKARIYANEDGLYLVYGANWTGSNWGRDTATGTALILRVGGSAIRWETRDLSVSATWSDSSWEEGGYVAKGFLSFTSVSGGGYIDLGDSNPVAGTYIPNRLYAKNTVKAFGRVDVGASPNVVVGFNVSSVSYNTNYILRVTLAQAFSSSLNCCTVTSMVDAAAPPLVPMNVVVISQSTNTIEFVVIDSTGARLDLTAYSFDINFCLLGEY